MDGTFSMCCLAVRRTSVFLILFAFCGSLVPSMGQPMNTASGSNTTILGQIPQPMKRFIAHQTVAGTVTLVAHGGNVVEFHALGMADRRGVRSQRSAALHEDLSAQEYKVLLALAAGRRTGEVASELNLSAKTVSTYKRRVLNKLGIESTAALVRYVIDNKLS